MKKNYFFSVAQALVNLFFPILSFPYASRVLGPEGLGKMQSVLAFAQYLALFAALGIPIYGIKAIAAVRDDVQKINKTFSELMLIYFGMSVLVSIIYFTIISSFDYFNSSQSLYLHAIWLTLLAFSYTDWYFQGIENFKILAWRSVFIKSVALIALFVFVKTNQDYLAYLYINIFLLLGSNFLNLWQLRHLLFFNIKILEFKKHIRPLITIFATVIAASTYTVLDTVLLGFYSDEKNVGLYTAAIKLSKVSLPFITSIGLVFIPSIANLRAKFNVLEANKLIQDSIGYVVLLAMPISIGLFLFAPWFIEVFSGNAFKDAVYAMQYLAFLPIIVGVGYVLAFQVLVPAEKNKQMLYAVLLGVIICLILFPLIVPKHGELGAAVIILITEITVTLAYYITVYRMNIKLSSKYLYEAIVASASFWLVGKFAEYFLMDFSVWLKLVIVILVCGFFYFSIQLWVFKNCFLQNIIHHMLKKIKR